MPETTQPMAMPMPHSTLNRPRSTRRHARLPAAIAAALLAGMFAGCASEPEPPQSPSATAQANGQTNGQPASKAEDDSWWPSLPHLGVPKVHKIVIQQGNVITQQMVDRLKPGMTKAQALYVMGRPVLEDLFDPDRWVYIYSVQIPDEPEIKQTLTLYFEKDALTRFTGDFTPTPAKAETAAGVASPAAIATNVPAASAATPATATTTAVEGSAPAAVSPAANAAPAN